LATSIDVPSLEILVRKVVEAGARLCVLADMSGLPIVSSAATPDQDERCFSALSSVVLAMGEDIAREIGGDVLAATVRTSESTLLASTIPGLPPTMLITIVDKETLRRQVEGEMERLRNAIGGATMGIATEIRASSSRENVEPGKLEAFFRTLELEVEKIDSAEALAYLIQHSKDDMFEEFSGFSSVAYSMGSFARQLRNRGNEHFADVKKDTLARIEEWKKQMAPGS